MRCAQDVYEREEDVDMGGREGDGIYKGDGINKPPFHLPPSLSFSQGPPRA